MFVTSQLLKEADYRAPSGAEIRLLPDVEQGGLCHCTLPVSTVSKPIRHKTVEEIWYFLSGTGEVWRTLDGKEQVVSVTSSTSITIPKGASFQTRNTGSTPLCFLCVTFPRWSGAEEAVSVDGIWIPMIAQAGD